MVEPSTSPPEPEKKEGRPQSAMAQVARYSHIGFMLPAAAMVGYAFGWLLDRWLGTTWIQIAGVVVGMVAGMMEVIRLVMRDKG